MAAQGDPLPTVRTDARGAATLTLPRSRGALAGLLASRPPARGR